MSRVFNILGLVLLLGINQRILGQVPAVSDDQPYVLATKMPEFSDGGSAGMIEFIQDHLEYPMAEKKANIQGTIMMQFIVEKDGSLSDIKAIKSVEGGDNLVKEAIRVIKLMPKWKPGMQDLHNVRVYKNVPFYFVIAQRKTGSTPHTSPHPPVNSNKNTTQHK